MAVVTVDRFAAIRADFKEGQLITRAMTWPGGDLLLNCNYTRYAQGFYNAGGGSIEVEVRDEHNQPIPEFCGEQRARFNQLSPFPWKEEQNHVRCPKDRSLKEMA